jgi:hypothetical protein
VILSTIRLTGVYTADRWDSGDATYYYSGSGSLIITDRTEFFRSTVNTIEEFQEIEHWRRKKNPSKSLPPSYDFRALPAIEIEKVFTPPVMKKRNRYVSDDEAKGVDSVVRIQDGSVTTGLAPRLPAPHRIVPLIHIPTIEVSRSEAWRPKLELLGFAFTLCPAIGKAET